MPEHAQQTHNNAKSDDTHKAQKPEQVDMIPAQDLDIMQTLFTGQSLSHETALQLQRTLGNQATSRLLQQNSVNRSKKPSSWKTVVTTSTSTDDPSQADSDADLIQRTTMKVETGIFSKTHRIYQEDGTVVGTIAGGEILEIDDSEKVELQGGKFAYEIKDAVEQPKFKPKNPKGLLPFGSPPHFIKAANVKVAKKQSGGLNLGSNQQNNEKEVSTGRTGHTGKVGQGMSGGKVLSQGVVMQGQGKKVMEQFSDKISENEQEGIVSAFSANGDSLTKNIEAVGADTAIASDFLGALNDSQKMFDKIVDVASKGMPIASAVIKVGTTASAAWSGWKTYSVWKGAAKDAIEALVPNEDMSGKMDVPLLVDVGGKSSATYAQAKTLRALVSKILDFATAIAKAVGEIAALFTAGAGALISLSASIINSVGTAGRWMKALYKIAKNTKGKNREKHAKIVMTAADSGDEDMLMTLINLGLTSDKWMVTLAAKLGEVYDPDTDGAGWYGKTKGKLVKAGSKQATKYAQQAKELGKDLGNKGGSIGKFASGKIGEQFVDDADEQTKKILLNKPRTPNQMHTYIQNLKSVKMYNDFTKAVMEKMKSQ